MAKPPAKKAVKAKGRPSMFDRKIADELLERLTESESLRQICEDQGMPNRSTVARWLTDDEDFRDQYARVREMQADYMDALILETANACTSETAAADRIKIDAYKWRAGKLKPKAYGDKLDLTSAGEKLSSDLDPVARATRLAAIFASIENRKGADEPD